MLVPQPVHKYKRTKKTGVKYEGRKEEKEKARKKGEKEREAKFAHLFSVLAYCRYMYAWPMLNYAACIFSGLFGRSLKA